MYNREGGVWLRCRQIYSDDVVVVVNIFPQYSFTLWLRYVLVFVKQNL